MTVSVNLLPWRVEKRERETKEFISFSIAGAVVAILIVLAMYFYVSSLENEQRSLNKRLEREIKIMDTRIAQIKKIKQLRSALISRMSIIQSLQETRPLTVHLVDEIIKVLPKGIHIEKIERKGDLILITGFVESNSSVSVMMRNIHDSHWINYPRLSEIKKSTSGGETKNVFRLSFTLKPKNVFKMIM